ncbi:hypothetical protein AMAG_07935 [Allomyces macrogynus ATCC 38327]|uniref:Uncharacterized protein n=1 Tax=Allomyces macrogynus (strain ATCC 38327) TaxID=578462 RepID=A0A0L0SJZ2_ALLM3|nr:hypothetical protein AMAG_07935 [Allomyces macrogynus ATCC 38327]|eukprot:KNE62749.1 hypothetical protein AMAG_07935 [Allomyces macrogynus ATCC 38327]
MRGGGQVCRCRRGSGRDIRLSVVVPQQVCWVRCHVGHSCQGRAGRMYSMRLPRRVHRQPPEPGRVVTSVVWWPVVLGSVHSKVPPLGNQQGRSGCQSLRASQLSCRLKVPFQLLGFLPARAFKFLAAVVGIRNGVTTACGVLSDRVAM